MENMPIGPAARSDLRSEIAETAASVSPSEPHDGIEAPPDAGTPLAARQGSAALKQLYGAVLAYMFFWQITPRVPTDQMLVVGFTTLLSLLLVLLITVSLAQSLRTTKSLGINLAVSGLLTTPLVLLPVLATRFPEWTAWRIVGPWYGAYLRAVAGIWGLNGLLLIWLATCSGVWVSRLVKELKILFPIALVLALVDLYVVFGGGLVTQATSGNAPVATAAMQALTVRLPAPHASRGAVPMQLAVGFADFLFIGLFFACFARFGVPSRATFYVLCATLVLYMYVVFQFGVALPALVPIAVVVIGMNLRAFRYARSELFALLYAGLLVVAILGGLFLFSRH